ncbi:efflux RND transporter periplasmic adaptor subunit [Exilibacterium tricleocarpae]|uniref:Efflux RND transporter periplasmic adaptor subunit n=1 Tax=Exilibacterium tricleocarpae TaxID=2591008 RepID=A0A545TSA2_9GAMM|nr:efflux RND transporter periplasmic adaptor subunit [Exilibacterium tricleocarpae]TQV80093.1 efflux RND transporter periplasmic adaptor subunit [Exilibacterium tricleocarpae]
MSGYKKLLYPVCILLCGLGAMLGFASLSKEPVRRVVETPAQPVHVAPVEYTARQLRVFSQGVVQPKYQTRLTAEVEGKIIYLAGGFVRGGFVKKGELLVQVDAEDYQAALTEAEAQLAEAEAAYELELARGRIARDERRTHQAIASRLGLRKPQLAMETARVKAASAALRRAESDLAKTNIHAPFDLLVYERDVSLATYVQKGQDIGTVFDSSVAEVRLPVAGNQLQYLPAPDAVREVVIEALYEGKKQQWSGRIVREEGVIDQTSRMTYLVAEIPDPYGLQAVDRHGAPLQFGIYVTAVIAGKKLSRASSIPQHLVIDERVAVMDENHKLRLKTVEIARREGDDVIIVSGIEDSEHLILSALTYAVEGTDLLPLATPAVDVSQVPDNTLGLVR